MQKVYWKMVKNKTTKGFSLLELLVIITIIGALATIGYPNLQKNNKQKKINNAVNSIVLLIEKAKFQVENNNYAQAKIIFYSDDPLQVTTSFKYNSSFQIDKTCGFDNCDITLPPTTFKDIILFYTVAPNNELCISKNGEYPGTIYSDPADDELGGFNSAIFWLTNMSDAQNSTDKNYKIKLIWNRHANTKLLTNKNISMYACTIYPRNHEHGRGLWHNHPTECARGWGQHFHEKSKEQWSF